MSKHPVIELIDLIGEDSAYGVDEGREIYQKLLSKLDGLPQHKIVGISLHGVTRTDASFPRESVVSLVKSRSGEKGFYLQGFCSADLMDNWDYAAKAKNVSLIVIEESGYKTIGAELSDGNKELLDLVMTQSSITTSSVAKALEISAQNASAKLKKLMALGLVMGSKQAADTGGMEFIYTPIKPD
ncbi:MAG: DNA-binding protein [Pseudomonadaceae bacterium]|nr:DNA-binding protein [Pseudomonadaceae bacterium]